MITKTLAPKITIGIINLMIAGVVAFGLFIAISILIAVRPLENQLPSTEGVTEWRSNAHINFLDYRLDVDHVYTTHGETPEYYKMISIRIPGVRYSYPTNTDQVKPIMKLKGDPAKVFASVDPLGSELTLRVKDTSLQNILLFGFVLIILFVLTLATIWLLNFKRLIVRLSNDETQFHPENVRSLTQLGIILLAFAFTHFIIVFILNLLVVSNLIMSASGNVSIDFNFQIGIIFFALTLLTLSSVFYHGSKIKEEQELTV